MSIHLVLDQLEAIHHISILFRNELTVFLSEVSKDKSDSFLRIGQMATWACMLVTGYVKGTVFDGNGKEIVVRFYGPLSFMTDLDSFYQNVPAKINLTAITPCTFQFLEKSYYLKLEKYAETEKLKAHMLLLEKNLAIERNLIMRLRLRERFAAFAKIYPVGELPNRDCASFLNMTEADYSRQKAYYFRNL